MLHPCFANKLLVSPYGEFSHNHKEQRSDKLKSMRASAEYLALEFVNIKLVQYLKLSCKLVDYYTIELLKGIVRQRRVEYIQYL